MCPKLQTRSFEVLEGPQKFAELENFGGIHFREVKLRNWRNEIRCTCSDDFAQIAKRLIIVENAKSKCPKSSVN